MNTIHGLRWYTRDLPLEGEIEGPEDGLEYFAPYLHDIYAPGRIPHAIVRSPDGAPVGNPVPLFIRLWLLDKKPVISVYSAGHEEYYVLLLDKWNPRATSVFKGYGADHRAELTFHPQF